VRAETGSGRRRQRAFDFGQRIELLPQLFPAALAVLELLADALELLGQPFGGGFQPLALDQLVGQQPDERMQRDRVWRPLRGHCPEQRERAGEVGGALGVAEQDSLLDQNQRGRGCIV